MHSIELFEPSRWMNILNLWLDIQTKYEWISNLAPFFADIFVIAYPIFLIGIYLYWIIKKKPMVKQWAVYVFFATFLAVLINIWIQSFFYKERPIVVLNQVEMEETLLHDICQLVHFHQIMLWFPWLLLWLYYCGEFTVKRNSLLGVE